jgi:proteasome lid subunit RPN8/RPN11
VTAAAKMLNHATFGVPNEVMGLMTGFYREEKNYGVFTVTDILALPVESSETRVTADDETNLLIAGMNL